MADPPPDLSIVIVSYNTCQLLLDCIASIDRCRGALGVEILVIDNASTDGSPQMVRDHWPQVVLIANPDNRYFSAANNQGIRAARGDYVLVLNPDTVIEGNTLIQLVTYLRRHPEVGAATTTMRFPGGRLQQNGSTHVTLQYMIFQYTWVGKLFRATTRRLNQALWLTDWDRQTVREVGILPGSAIIARRDRWLAIGGFHESLPMYFSDDYFSTEVQKRGLQTVFVPSDGIIHYENASTRHVSRRAVIFYFRDLLTYTRMIFGRPAQLLMATLLVPTYLVQWIEGAPKR